MGDKKSITKIFPNFYMGTLQHAKNEDLMFDLDVSHIVSVGSGSGYFI
jgi:hypothetical protein